MKITKYETGPLGVNTYLVIDEATKKGFIVDPGGRSSKLDKKIKEEDAEIQAIILTHGHSDHMGGAEDYLKACPKAVIIAHEEEVPILADPNMNMSNMVLGQAITLIPGKTVKEGDEVKIGKMTLTFRHTPGHSPGGMCILVEDVVFSGDSLFFHSIGRTDFPGGSFREMIESIHRKLFTLPDETEVFPGHMGSTRIGDEKEHNPFV